MRSSSDWTDGFIGVRLHNSLGDKWSWVFRANAGAGGSDLALGMDIDFHREFSNGNQFLVGFRMLGIDDENSSGAVRTELDMMIFSGLTIGYTFNF